jgi:hypothetical protein
MATLIRAELSPPGLQLADPTLAGMPHRIADYAGTGCSFQTNPQEKENDETQSASYRTLRLCGNAAVTA